MIELDVIDDPAAATVALDPVRSRLLSLLREPASAAALAGRLKLPRQKVNYHLRTLEAHGLVTVADERRWGGIRERMLVATASSYLIAPDALGPVAVTLHREMDRLSARYLIALAARVIREITDLVRRASKAGRKLATLSIDTEIRFRSAAERAAFTQELTTAINSLVSRYHDETAPDGRTYRLLIMAHPQPVDSETRKSHAR